MSKRDVVRSVRFDSDEIVEIERRARDHGMQFGPWLRYCERKMHAILTDNGRASPRGSDGQGTEGQTPKVLDPAPARTRAPSHKLDEIGPDPLRGGTASAKR